jgi:hypothetical protein
MWIIKLVSFVISSLIFCCNAQQVKSFSVLSVRNEIKTSQNQAVKLAKSMVTSFYDQWQRFWSII